MCFNSALCAKHAGSKKRFNFAVMSFATILGITIIITAALAAYKLRKLTRAGSLAGGLVATCIFLGAGFVGIALLAAFFVMAILATSWKKPIKLAATANNHHPETRNAGQVLANGGVAALAGVLAFMWPSYNTVFIVLMAAALASATADTLSSELGTVYGRRFYNIISLKPDQKGRDGVISLEGTMTGLGGSAVIALIYSTTFGWQSFLIIVIAGTAGNVFDSVLGATLERKGAINNDIVNALNTFFAAVVAYLLLLI